MKISNLIELLNQIPGDVEVMVASDQEGNAFNRLTFFGYGYVEKAKLNTYQPEVAFPDDEDADEYEGDPAYTEVFILYP